MEGLGGSSGGSHLCSDAFRRIWVQKITVSSNCYFSATTATPEATIGTTAQRSVTGQSIVCAVSLWTTSLQPFCGQKPANSLRQCFLQVLLRPSPPSQLLVDQGRKITTSAFPEKLRLRDLTLAYIIPNDSNKSCSDILISEKNAGLKRRITFIVLFFCGKHTLQLDNEPSNPGAFYRCCS